MKPDPGIDAREKRAFGDAHEIADASPAAMQDDVLRLSAIDIDSVRQLLAAHGLALERLDDGAAIPGSYWGEPEAGVVANTVYVRDDTPVHSLLHEACHLIVAPPERRARIHTDASDSQAEEDATCYLQIVLADRLSGVGSARVCADMDRWGYTFRLGSAQAWFERDAEDASAWLVQRGLLPEEEENTSPACGRGRRQGG